MAWIREIIGTALVIIGLVLILLGLVLSFAPHDDLSAIIEAGVKGWMLITVGIPVLATGGGILSKG